MVAAVVATTVVVVAAAIAVAAVAANIAAASAAVVAAASAAVVAVQTAVGLGPAAVAACRRPDCRQNHHRNCHRLHHGDYG